MGKIVLWLFGRYRVRCLGSAHFIATVLMKQLPEAYGHELCDGGVEFYIPRRKKKRFDAIAAEYGLCAEYICEEGLPMLLYRYRRRAGIPVGILLFFMTVILSGSTVWNIELEDSGNVPAEVILSRLEDMGLKYGAFIPSLNLDSMCTRYVSEYDDLAWISVNMYGSTAKVEVLEELHGGDDFDRTPSSLVSECDGQVAYLNVTSGTPQVNVGDTVLAGEGLVSGIVEYKDGSVRAVRSVGEVYAYTRRTAEVFIPFEYDRKVPTGLSESRRTLMIFGFPIKLYINEMKLNENYDTIIEVKRASLPFDTLLPLSVETVTRTGYAFETVRLTEEEVMRLAEKRAGEVIAEAAQDCELLGRTVTKTLSEGGCLVKCELYCLENIASEIPLMK